MSYLESTATLASPVTKSLRATLPQGVVAFLGLADGDKIQWKMEVIDGEKVTIARKAPLTKEAFDSATSEWIRRRKTK